MFNQHQFDKQETVIVAKLETTEWFSENIMNLYEDTWGECGENCIKIDAEK